MTRHKHSVEKTYECWDLVRSGSVCTISQFGHVEAVRRETCGCGASRYVLRLDRDFFTDAEHNQDDGDAYAYTKWWQIDS